MQIDASVVNPDKITGLIVMPVVIYTRTAVKKVVYYTKSSVNFILTSNTTACKLTVM